MAPKLQKKPRKTDRSDPSEEVRKERHPLALDLLVPVLWACAVYFMICLLDRDGGTGVLGTYVTQILQGLFGLGAYGMCVVLFLFGLFILLEYVWTPRPLDYWLGFLLLVTALGLTHMICTAGGNDSDVSEFGRYLKNCFEMGQAKIGGGFFGGLVTYPMVKFIGRTGAWIMDIVVLTGVLLAWTRISLRRLANRAAEAVAEKQEERRAKKQKREQVEQWTRIRRGFEEEDEPVEKKPVSRGTGKRHAASLPEDYFQSDPLGDDPAKSSDPQIKDVPRVRKSRDVKIPMIRCEMHPTEEAPETSTAEASETNSKVKKRTSTKESTAKASGKKSAAPESETSREIPKAPDAPVEPPEPVYLFPPMDLLSRGKAARAEDPTARARKLQETFENFGIRAEVAGVCVGPAITQFEVHPGAGVKSASIVNLANDIALNLAAPSVRIEAPIPGKAAIGVEIPNETISTVMLRDVVDSPDFEKHKSKIAFGLGRDIVGRNVIADVGKMPHMLIAGATGSGKSVCINSLIVSLLYKATPDEVKMIMIDPKMVELNVYNGIPHLLIPVVTDPKKAAGALNWAVGEMTRRYQVFSESRTRNIQGYNDLMEENGGEKLPSIVIIIDELADLMMAAPGDVEDSICRLAQLARAAGMYLVIATQRPSVDVITGVIKANIPSRIAFAVSSQVDSKTILDMGGAEKLLGKGDMLYAPAGSTKPKRVQGCFVPDEEVEEVVAWICDHNTGLDYDQDIQAQVDSFEVSKGKRGGGASGSDEDEPTIDRVNQDALLGEVIEKLYDQQQLSISMVQRKMGVGYARAARIVDQLESMGIVEEGSGAKPRRFLKSRQEIERILNGDTEEEE